VEARRFWAEQVGTKEAGVNVQELEGYEEIWRKIVEKAPLTARLAGLTPEQAVLALPDEVLRGFSDAYLATLSEPTQAAIRARLGR
jgi:hypothetical protein